VPLVESHITTEGSTVQGWQNKGWAMALAALMVSMAAPAAAQTSAATTADADTPTTDADLANARCVSGEEKFLPGDYYYCLGSQNFGLGHYESSQRFFKTAASWASKPAQYVLGIMALNGDHQPVNRPLGLAWLALASERPNSNFQQAHDTAWKSATEAERKQAEQELAKLRPEFGDAVAGPRAERRYADGMAKLTRLTNQGAKYCMAGMNDPSKPNADASACPPVQMVMKMVDTAAINVFDGWSGHVTVGPLEQAAPPAAAGKN
jgi:hypothetical protein